MIYYEYMNCKGFRKLWNMLTVWVMLMVFLNWLLWTYNQMYSWDAHPYCWIFQIEELRSGAWRRLVVSSLFPFKYCPGHALIVVTPGTFVCRAALVRLVYFLMFVIIWCWYIPGVNPWWFWKYYNIGFVN